MAEPFALPDHAQPRVGTTAPVAKISTVSDLIPGVNDIPYLDSHFGMHEIKKVSWLEPAGRRTKNVERSGLYRATATMWNPTTEERNCIAAGGAIQVLDFRCQEPLMHVGAMWFKPQSVPNQHIVENTAMTMYEELNGIGSWEGATEALKNRYRTVARRVASVVANNLRK